MSSKNKQTKSDQTAKMPSGMIKEANNFIPESTLDSIGFFKKWWLASVLIMASSFLLYFASISYGYILDDQMVITGNSFTKKGFAGIYDIMTTESFTGYFGEQKELVQGNRYRPLSIITFAMEYGILGKENPSVSHFINILLYGLTGILLLLTLTKLMQRYSFKNWWFSIPFVAVLLYMAHPIHTEAVANIKGRDEIMSMLFSLMAMYAAIRYAEVKKLPYLVYMSLAYLLGLLSKENAITFFAVIPLAIYYFIHYTRGSISKIMIWLSVATIAYLSLRFTTAGVPKFGQEITDIMNNPFLGMTPLEKFGTTMYTLGKYILLMVFPHPLSHDYYPYAIPKVTIFNIWSALSIIIYIGLTYIGLKSLKSKSVYGFSILFYLLTLSIVSNLMINVGTFMNERFIFMASAGFCLAVGYLLVEHLPKLVTKGSLIGMAIFGLLTVGYAAKTILRVPAWKDSYALNKSAVEASGGSARANSFMATAIFEQYKTTTDPDKKTIMINQVEDYANKALAIVPNYSNANTMLIGAITERFKSDGDIKAYVKSMIPAMVRRPDEPFIKTFNDYLHDKVIYENDLFTLYLKVGEQLAQTKDTRKSYAMNYLGMAYKINTEDYSINQVLANTYEALGETQKAAEFQRAADYYKK